MMKAASLTRFYSTVLALLVCGVSAFGAVTAEDLIKQAQQLDDAGSTQKALGLYQDFLTKCPGHSQTAEVQYRVAKCYDNMGDVDQAISWLKKAAQDSASKFRNRPDALFMLGKLQGSMKDYDAAIQTFEKLLAGGAGFYEDEATNLCAGYYAIREKYDDAAAKFNLLRRKTDSKLAEQAAYKLAVLWLKAGKMDLAVAAIQDLARQFPNNKQVPELLLKTADAFRLQKKLDKATSVCEQLSAKYPGSVESLGAAYLTGLCYQERGDSKKAVELLNKVSQNRDPNGRAMVAEALVASAAIYEMELKDQAAAMQRYEDASKIARSSDSDRKTEILEQCYFHLGEYYYQQKKWGVALENYTQLRDLGTSLNISARILECQSHLGDSKESLKINEAGTEALKAKIAQNPGTATAAEAEVFLLDRQLSATITGKRDTHAIVASYEKLLASYPKQVLAGDYLEAYIQSQIGTGYRACENKEDWAKAVQAFEKAIAFDTSNTNPYKVPALESIAVISDQLGDKDQALKAYNELFAISRQHLAQNKGDKSAAQKTLDYMKSIATRADSGSGVDKAIAMTKSLIEEQGAVSDLSANSRFYLGELYIVKKDYSTAAAAFKELIRIHGPEQDDNGDIVNAPWKPQNQNDMVQLIYDSASRIADAWYLQGHTENMIKAYEWIARNIPNGNRHMAEAQYWLAVEKSRGKDANTPEAKQRLAESLWQNVVNTSFEVDSKDFKKTFQPWVKGSPDAQKYVKTAILKSGQIFSEINEHEKAAAVFNQYLQLFPDNSNNAGHPGKGKNGAAAMAAETDEMGSIARFALGREYLTSGSMAPFVETYGVYTSSHRNDRFRVSGLKLLGYHGSRAGASDKAIAAYATLLDEYGPTPVNSKTGAESKVPRNEWLRAGDFRWDGSRMEPPKELDLGEIRFALGFLYWQARDWGRCAQTLSPFLGDQSLARNKSRPKALFMAGQSYCKAGNDADGVKDLQALIKDYPDFEAMEEAYEKLAAGLVETRNWKEVDAIKSQFIARWPQSDRRPRMDVYSGAAYAAQGQRDRAMLIFNMLLNGDIFGDVKADAGYYAGKSILAAKPNGYAEALPYFEKSIAALANPRACLEAARCYQKLGRPAEARTMLERIPREFSNANPQVLNDSKNVMTAVLNDLTKQK